MTTQMTEKLRQIASKMQPQIDQKLNPPIAQQNPTPRRASIAQSMAEDGRYLQRIQGKLLALAAAHEDGTLPPLLAKITARTQIESLLRHDSFPDSNHEADGKRLLKVGIGVENFAQAKAALVQLGDGVPEEMPVDVQIRQLETKLLSMRITGYVPTPSGLAERMVALAELKPGETVLEPSAGKGDIAQTIRAKHPDISLNVIEPATVLRDILSLKKFELVGRDFFEHTDEYDCVIQNPPFEKLADIDHVRHDYSLLKVGGRLISVMGEGAFFRTDKKAVQFRRWLEQVGGSSEKLPADTFKPSGTTVAARLVQIKKGDTGTTVESVPDKDLPPDSLICSAELLSQALKDVLPVVPRNSTLPVLEAVCFAQEKGRLTVQATNLSITLTRTLFCDSKLALNLYLPARLLYDFVSSLPADQPLTFEIDEDTVTVRSGQYVSCFKPISEADHFWQSNSQQTNLFTTDSEPSTVSLSGKALRACIERTKYAAAEDESRPILTGLLLTAAQSTLTAVGANGFVLATTNVAQRGEFEFIVPSKALALLKLHLIDESEITVTYTADNVEFDTGEFRLGVKLLVGEYPDYKKVIPQTWQKEVLVDRQELLSTLRLAQKYTDNHSRVVLKLKYNRLVVSAKSHYEATFERYLPATVEGGPLEIHFNGSYLYNSLKAMIEEEVFMRFSGASNPCLLMDTSGSHVVMPLYSEETRDDKSNTA